MCSRETCFFSSCVVGSKRKKLYSKANENKKILCIKNDIKIKKFQKIINKIMYICIQNDSYLGC